MHVPKSWDHICGSIPGSRSFTPFEDNSSLFQPLMRPCGLQDFALSESGKQQFTSSVCRDKPSQPPVSSPNKQYFAWIILNICPFNPAETKHRWKLPATAIMADCPQSHIHKTLFPFSGRLMCFTEVFLLPNICYAPTPMSRLHRYKRSTPFEILPLWCHHVPPTWINSI